jgi:hypothetical protein
VLGFLAAVGASAVFGAPVLVGPVMRSSPEGLELIADPVAGAWLQYEGPNGAELRRITERGGVSVVPLPAALRHEELTFIPFRDGWAFAVARRPLSRSQEAHCEGPTEPVSGTCYGPLMVAERSPSGHWTKVRALPFSATQQSYAEAVESAGRVELAWGDREEGQIRVAAAPLGRPFGPGHLAQPVLHGKPEKVSLTTRLGHLYIRAEFGPHGEAGSGSHVVERRLFGSGKLGPPHFLRSRLVKEQGTSIPGPHASELYVYQEFESIGVARRRLWEPGYRAAKLLTKAASYGFKLSQSNNSRVLISFETYNRKKAQSSISAAEISPAGQLGPTRTVEFDPNKHEASYHWDASVDNQGDSLIAMLGQEEGSSVWVRVASSRCPTYSARIQLAANAISDTERTVAAVAGRDNVFHTTWLNAQHEVEITSGRVSCH